MESVRRLVNKGLEKTAPLWPDGRFAFEQVWEAAQLLKNTTCQKSATLKQHDTDFLRHRRQRTEQAGSLKGALEHLPPGQR